MGYFQELKVLYESWAEPAHARLMELFKAMTDKMQGTIAQTVDDKRLILLGRLATKFPMEYPAMSSDSALRSAISTNAGVDTLQERFGDFYYGYQALTSWLHLLGDVIEEDNYGADESPTSIYGLWKAADEKFLDHLKDLLPRAGFEALKGRVQTVGWGEQFRNRTLLG